MCTCTAFPTQREAAASSDSTADCTACRRWALAWAHRDELLAVARRRMVCREDADDVVNEAMLRAVEFDGLDESRIAAWMTRVVVNLCTDAARDRARTGKRWRYAVMMDMSAPSPEDLVVDRAAAATACTRLSDLPTAQREAVLLRADGLPVGQVAAQLGVGYKAAESLLSRGRAALNAALIAAIAGILGGLRTVKRGAVPVSGMAAAALVIATWPPQPEAPVTGGGVAAADQVAPAANAAAALPSQARAVPGPAAPPARSESGQLTEPRAVADHEGRSTRDVVTPVGADAAGVKVTVGGATAEEHERAWEEELISCVLNGELVTPEYIGCPPPDDSSPDAAKDGPRSP